MHTIAVIVGSLRKESMNRALAQAVALEGKDLFTFNWVRIDDIPLYNQDLDDNMPSSVLRLKKEVQSADAILFATPEYNRSVPGVLKNIIDWGSRPRANNSWSKKPATLMGASPGAVGTAVAQAELRSILTMLGMVLVKQPELYISMREGLIDTEGAFADPSTRAFIRGYLEKMHSWLKSYYR